MGQSRPIAVVADPSRRHEVGAWTVHALADDRRFDVRGTVTWIGRPSGSPTAREWLIMAAANLTLIIAGLGVWLIPSRRRRQRRPHPRAGSPDPPAVERIGISAAGLTARSSTP